MALSPAAPPTNDVLTTTASATDPDGDAVTFTYVWRPNGAVVPGQSGRTLDLRLAGHGARGDVITVAATPTAGTLAGTPATAADAAVLAAANAVTLRVLVRFNADGRLDTSFNATGIVRTNSPNQQAHVAGMAIQSDGRIVVAGWFVAGLGLTNDLALAGYKAWASRPRRSTAAAATTRSWTPAGTRFSTATKATTPSSSTPPSVPA